MHGAEFPEESVKIYVTCVSPTGNKNPGAWVLTTSSTPVKSSTAVGSNHVAMALVSPSDMVTGTFAGQSLITGGVVSGALVTVGTKFESVCKSLML